MRVPVAVAACPDYTPAAVRAAVDALVERLGGLAGLVRPGGTVLLKPNLLTDRTPDRATTTHPEVVRALIRWVRQRGGRPVVADSACSAVKTAAVWEQTGFRAMCAAESVPLLNLEQTGSVLFRRGPVSYSVAKPVLDADLVINVPKFKTHLLTGITNAVKNVFGTLPGFQKTLLHKWYPTPRAFSEFLAELYPRVRPALSVSDAVVAMDGPGPSGGDPVALGALAASTDGVALDAALCGLLRVPLRAVPYLGMLARAGVGCADPRFLEVRGDVPGHWAGLRFRLPRVASLLDVAPVWLVRLLGPLVWIRPAFSDACVRCGRCVAACPAQALRLPAGAARPVLRTAACIGCCCCHEVCPRRAVAMTQSALLRWRKHGALPS